MTSPASPQAPAPQGMTIRWFSQIRTKLFASLILLASCTVVACAVSVWLFDGFSSLFSRTIRRDFATFGSMVRLQEEASQLVQLTGSLSASVRPGQLAAVLDAITAGRDKAAYAVVVLHGRQLSTRRSRSMRPDLMPTSPETGRPPRGASRLRCCCAAMTGQRSS